jgi:hypothetical protein
LALTNCAVPYHTSQCILGWTAHPAQALATAQKLNDMYALDGNDPNGFVGVGWSIMGIHDRTCATNLVSPVR